jgi:hypothetical protein
VAAGAGHLDPGDVGGGGVNPGVNPGGGPGPGRPGSGAPTRLPLGTLIGARSGDKGGNANVGLWAPDDTIYAWLQTELTVERFRQLLPEAATLGVDRFELPNLRALNFVVHGLLGEGVASSTRPDAQAKSLGEYLRSRLVDVPPDLLTGDPDHGRETDQRSHDGLP